MNGLLLVDKPAGMTSHDVVRAVRKIFHTRKVGHAGTLDPLATGVLPVAVGNGTKILQFLLAENKSYRATCKLGWTTDTLDCEGKLLQERPVPPLDSSLLEKLCAEFRGTIDQLPPMYSALKQNGVPLYKLARQGKTVERASRSVTISRLDLLGFDTDQVEIEVDCSKGTYIRSLVHDLGEKLGCGACLSTLRRLRSGDFHLAECRTLEALRGMADPALSLLSLEAALRAYPAVALTDKAAAALRCGIPPQLEETAIDRDLPPGTQIRLQVAGELAAMARFAPQRGQRETR